MEGEWLCSITAKTWHTLQKFYILIDFKKRWRVKTSTDLTSFLISNVKNTHTHTRRSAKTQDHTLGIYAQQFQISGAIPELWEHTESHMIEMDFRKNEH